MATRPTVLRAALSSAVLVALLTATVASGAAGHPAPIRAAHHSALPAGGGKYEQIVSVSAIPHSKNAYAVGTNGLGLDNNRFYLLSEHGGHFKRIWAPKLGNRYGHLDSVYAVSKHNVFIGGAIGVGHADTKVAIWHMVGHKIKPAKLGKFNFGIGSNGVGGFSSTGPKDVWAIGSFYPNNTGGPQAMHWNGHAWSVTATPWGLNYEGLHSIASAGRKAVWGLRDDGHVLFWDGKQWTDFGLPFGDGGTAGAVTASSPSRVYLSGTDAAGKHEILRFDGKHTHKTKIKGVPSTAPFNSLTINGKNAWAVANYRNKANWNVSVIIHTTGTTWKKQAQTHGHHLYGLGIISAATKGPAISAGYYYPTYQTSPTPLVATLKGHHWKIRKTKF
jgi:hypothetical protein